jgi:hypothetical protein
MVQKSKKRCNHGLLNVFKNIFVHYRLGIVQAGNIALVFPISSHGSLLTAYTLQLIN